jgi:tyrosinase
MATPAIAATPLTRRDAWKLSAISIWEPTLLWYAKAVGEMSNRPATDSTSWRFQAGIHGYDPSTDPFVNAGPIPTQDVQDGFWQKCQHGSWFFLPWHRMYLGFYEQIVRAAVVQLGGPADWTLPYWNYSDSSNPQAKTLPPCFRQPALPDGSPNPLFVIQGVNVPRAPGINSGDTSLIPDSDVDLSGCLEESFFSPDTDTTSGDLGFGGTATGFNHPGQVFGANSVESAPHNAIHVDVGGQWNEGGVAINGWMIDPDTAALDPIFWLHHANIDRLWSVWNGISLSNTNPAGSVNVGGQPISWSTSVQFSFYDANGNVVTMTPSQVLDTTTTTFSYDYEEAANLAAHPMTERTAAGRGTTMKPGLPEMVGANDKPVTLAGSTETTFFALQQPSGPALKSAAMRAEPAKTYLKIENVVSKKSHATYEVYVNLPDNPDAEAYKEHHAGAMHLFGVVQASTKSDRHSGNGLSFSIDITQLVNRLKAINDWDEKNIRVSFVPRTTGGTAMAAIAGHDPIRVGRVSLYVA